MQPTDADSANAGHVNVAFSPSRSTTSSAYYEMPKSTATGSTRISPTTPDVIRMRDVSEWASGHNGDDVYAVGKGWVN